MIVVTLGTIVFPFNRPLEWIDTLIRHHKITEPVFIQYGSSDPSVVAHHSLVTLEPMISESTLLTLIKDARLVISHAGQGSTRMLAEKGASFVLLPRLKQHREHIDNHQLWFARDMKQFGIKYCSSLEELETVILSPPAPIQIKLFDSPRLSDYLIKAHSQKAKTIENSKLLPSN